MLRICFIILIGYLLGSVNVAVMLTKKKYGRDVRTLGSGNAGATNVARVYGMGAGLITLCGDMAKTVLAALAGLLLEKNGGLQIACAACLIGHCWPVFHEFRGGKGVSVSGCIGLLLDWRMFPLLLAVFFLTFLCSRRVSLCSILAAAAFPMLYLLLGHGIDPGFAVGCLVTATVIFQHRGNIRRLLAGTEAKFTPGKKPETKENAE